MDALLPSGVHVFERGWLSSNNILIVSDRQSGLIDSGYCTHAAQTLSLVESMLGTRPLDLLLNTHLHSDHCGGNAALQARYPRLRTLIPPGQASEVQVWDETALSYAATGQCCPRFRFDQTLSPGSAIQIGDLLWEVYAACGHDPHAVLLFSPDSGTLISADALWEDGFGVVFPELEGEPAFSDVDATLDLIEHLNPTVVIPGHGKVFLDVASALHKARRRLDAFSKTPHQHYLYAAKVLIKFKLLDAQSCTMDALTQWTLETPYIARLQNVLFPGQSTRDTVQLLVDALIRSGAAVRDGETVFNGN